MSTRPRSTHTSGSATKSQTRVPPRAPTWEWTTPPTAAPSAPMSAAARSPRHNPFAASPGSSGTSITPSQITAMVDVTAKASSARPNPAAAPIMSLTATRTGRRGVASSVRAIVPCRNSLVNRRMPRSSASRTAGSAATSTRSSW